MEVLLWLRLLPSQWSGRINGLARLTASQCVLIFLIHLHGIFPVLSSLFLLRSLSLPFKPLALAFLAENGFQILCSSIHVLSIIRVLEGSGRVEI